MRLESGTVIERNNTKAIVLRSNREPGSHDPNEMRHTVVMPADETNFEDFAAVFTTGEITVRDDDGEVSDALIGHGEHEGRLISVQYDTWVNVQPAPASAAQE